MTYTLLGEWGFLDNLDDTSGNGRQATANFTPNYIPGPTAGERAIRFASATDQIVYGRTGLEPMTGGIITMAWVKLFGDVWGYVDILHKTRLFDSTRHGIDLHDNKLFAVSRWRDQLVFADSGLTLNDGTWHHLCNIDAEDRYAWFIDGVMIQGAARTPGAGNPPTWEDFPWVSGDNDTMVNTTANPDVALTGLRILQGTMTDEEVVQWMNTPITAAPSSGAAELSMPVAVGLAFPTATELSASVGAALELSPATDVGLGVHIELEASPVTEVRTGVQVGLEASPATEVGMGVDTRLSFEVDESGVTSMEMPVSVGMSLRVEPRPDADLKVSIPGFNAEEVRAGLRLAMNVGLPVAAADQPAFYFPTPVVTSPATDSEGTPLAWDAERDSGTAPPLVKVPCAIEYADSVGSMEGAGQVSSTRLLLTLLDEDYEQVKGFAYVVVGGNPYVYERTQPPLGLVSVGIWQIWVRSADEG